MFRAAQRLDLHIEIDKTPYKFERRDYLLDLLQSAGFAQIKIEAFDARVSSGNLDAMMAVLTRLRTVRPRRIAPGAHAAARAPAGIVSSRIAIGTVTVRAAVGVRTVDAGFWCPTRSAGLSA